MLMPRAHHPVHQRGYRQCGSLVNRLNLGVAQVVHCQPDQMLGHLRPGVGLPLTVDPPVTPFDLT
jgi:hypothetical protein